jgi:uncharacterized RDD family membrane protein YckC
MIEPKRAGPPPGPRTGRASGPRATYPRRFFALLVDGIVLSLVSEAVMRLLGEEGGSVLAALLSAYYLVVLIGGPRGQTLGCLLFQIRVVSRDGGGPVGYGHALVRWLVSIVSGSLLLLGYIWAFFDRERQTWHDKAAGTVVVPIRYYPIRR